MKRKIAGLIFAILCISQVSFGENRLPGKKHDSISKVQFMFEGKSFRIANEIKKETSESTTTPFGGRERNYSKYSYNILKRPLYA